MDTQTAISRVMSSAELLGMILLEVDQRTLLTNAQRVSKTWHSQIKSDPALQRHLFLQTHLQPHSNNRRNRHRADIGRIPISNPLLSKTFAPWFNGGLVDGTSSVSNYSEDESGDETPRQTKAGRLRRAGGENSHTELYRQLKSTGIYRARKQGQNPFLRTGSSWLQMQISDPPITRLDLHRKTSGEMGSEITVIQLHYADGLRMGQFYAISLALSNSCSRGAGMEIRWLPENMGLASSSEASTQPSGIMSIRKYVSFDLSYLIDTEDAMSDLLRPEEPEPSSANIILKTSEFFGCVRTTREREIKLHYICGRDFMSEKYENEVEAITKAIRNS